MSTTSLDEWEVVSTGDNYSWPASEEENLETQNQFDVECKTNDSPWLDVVEKCVAANPSWYFKKHEVSKETKYTDWSSNMSWFTDWSEDCWLNDNEEIFDEKDFRRLKFVHKTPGSKYYAMNGHTARRDVLQCSASSFYSSRGNGTRDKSSIDRRKATNFASYTRNNMFFKSTLDQVSGGKDALHNANIPARNTSRGVTLEKIVDLANTAGASYKVSQFKHSDPTTFSLIVNFPIIGYAQKQLSGGEKVIQRQRLEHQDYVYFLREPITSLWHSQNPISVLSKGQRFLDSRFIDEKKAWEQAQLRLAKSNESCDMDHVQQLEGTTRDGTLTQPLHNGNAICRKPNNSRDASWLVPKSYLDQCIETPSKMDKLYLELDLQVNCHVTHVSSMGSKPRIRQFPQKKDFPDIQIGPGQLASTMNYYYEYRGPQYDVVDLLQDKDPFRWVTSYSLEVRSTGGKWISLGEFKGNHDGISEEFRQLPGDGVVCRYLRFKPTSPFAYHGSHGLGMRVAAFGLAAPNSRKSSIASKANVTSQSVLDTKPQLVRDAPKSRSVPSIDSQRVIEEHKPKRKTKVNGRWKGMRDLLEIPEISIKDNSGNYMRIEDRTINAYERVIFEIAASERGQPFNRTRTFNSWNWKTYDQEGKVELIELKKRDLKNEARISMKNYQHNET